MEFLLLDFKIQNANKGDTLELPYFYSPGFTVKLMYENNEITLDVSESDKGFLQIIIPEDIEEGTITCDYTATTIEKVGYIISGISTIAFVGYIIYFIKRNKKEEAHEK